MIKSVLWQLVNMECDTLPKPSTLVDFMVEMKGQACEHIAEQLASTEKIILHSDGTSKFGQHYGGFQVSMVDHSTYSLGLSEMLTVLQM